MNTTKYLPALMIFLSATGCAANPLPFGSDYSPLNPPQSDPIMVGSLWSHASGFRPSPLSQANIENVDVGASTDYTAALQAGIDASLSSALRAVISASIGSDFAKDTKISIGSLHLQKVRNLIDLPIRDSSSVVLEAIYADRYTIQLSRTVDAKAAVAVTQAINQFDPKAQANITSNSGSVSVASPDSAIAVRLISWHQLGDRSERDDIPISSRSFLVTGVVGRKDPIQFTFSDYSPAYPGCLKIAVTDLAAIGDSKILGFCPDYDQLSGVETYRPIPDFTYPAWFNAYLSQASDRYYFLQINLAKLRFAYKTVGHASPELASVSGFLDVASVAFRGSVDSSQ